MVNPGKPQSQKKKSFDNYARYSGLAFEMIAIILVGVFGGIKLDEIFDCKPLLTALLSFVSVILAIYFAIKDFLRTPKNEGKNP